MDNYFSHNRDNSLTFQGFQLDRTMATEMDQV